MRSMALVLALAAAAAAVPAGEARAGDRHGVRRDLLVSTKWLAQRLGDPAVVVLHTARSRDGYDAGHVPGARFVAFSEVAVERGGVPNELPPAADLTALMRRLGVDATRRMVIYDEEGGLFAARLFVALDYLGLGDRAALLDGHLRRWRAEDRPLETAAPAVAPSAFAPRLRPEVIVGLDAVRDLSWAASQGGAAARTGDAAGAGAAGGGVALIDARPEVQHAGEDRADGTPRPGHIPGAASLYWMRALASREDPVLRPPAELRALFEAAGAGAGDTVVTYCRSGVQASHSYFVARYLGYDARLYDGSFSEWSARDDTPVAGPASAAPAP